MNNLKFGYVIKDIEIQTKYCYRNVWLAKFYKYDYRNDLPNLYSHNDFQFTYNENITPQKYPHLQYIVKDQKIWSEF